MARCRCTSQCACTIEAGQGIDISGTGDPSDPLVISGVPISGSVILDDTAEVDLVGSGSGTAADPLRLSAQLPWLSSTSGAVGDVLTQQADGSYAPGPPNVTAPGVTVLGHGLSGDGTAANPIRVDLCTYADLKAACAP